MPRLFSVVSAPTNSRIMSLLLGMLAMGLTLCHEVEFAVAQSAYQLDASAEMGPPGTDTPVTVTLDNGEAIDGFQFGMTYAPAVLSLSGVTQGAATAATNGGSGAAFFFVDLMPILPVGVDAGVVVGCIVSLAPPLDQIPAGTDQEIAIAGFSIEASALDGDTSPLTFSSDLGNPPVGIVVSVSGAPVVPATADGEVLVVLPPTPQFRRGDCNDDGAINLADVIFYLSIIFPTGTPSVPTCDDACDGNDDGTLNLADAITILGALFGSPIVPLSAPYPDCGFDPTPMMTLNCAPALSCP